MGVSRKKTKAGILKAGAAGPPSRAVFTPDAKAWKQAWARADNSTS
jgi:hypothetical protein